MLRACRETGRQDVAYVDKELEVLDCATGRIESMSQLQFFNK
jgi:hypothetical protein